MTYILQDFFITILRPFLSVADKLDERTKSILRVICFTGLFMLCSMTRVIRGANYQYYNYYTLACCIIMSIIMILSLDKKVERVNWDKSLSVILIILFMLMAISEFLIPKSQSYIEVVLIIFFGGLAFVWHNHENREVLWENIFIAIRITFLILVVISMLFRPMQEGCRYSGFFLNPNSAAYHLIPIIAVYIGTIDGMIRRKQPLWKALGCFVGLGVAMCFLLVSQSRTSFCAIFTMLGCWILIRLYISKNEKKLVLYLKYMAALICTIIIVYPVCNVMLHNVPNMVNHPIVYANDKPYRVRDFDYAEKKATGTKAPASKKTFLSEIEDILDSEFLDTILSGRLTVYKAYINRLNWIGHENVTINVKSGLWTSAHNNILQFAYIYGNLTIIPYIILILLALAYSIKYFVRNYNSKIYAIFPFIFVTGFAINTMFEAVFQPFHRFTAFIFWLIIGELLIDTINEKIKSRKVKAVDKIS